MKSDKLYKMGKSLGLSKKDINQVISASSSNSDSPSANMYKAGNKYGTVSPQEIYKAGTEYGTISPKELYKAGTRYGTISPYDLL